MVEGRIVVVQSAAAAHHPHHYHRLATALRDAGYDVLMLAQPDGREHDSDPVPVRYLPVRRNRLTRILTGPLTIARALGQRPAALYVVCLDLLPWAAAARLFRACKVVYDSDEEYDRVVLMRAWLPASLRRPIGAIIRHLEPSLASHLDAVTATLPAAHSKFQRGGARSLLVRSLPPDAVARAGASPRPDFDVLVAGTLERDQVRLLADTAAHLEQQNPGRRWLLAARNFTPADRLYLEAALMDNGVNDIFEIRINVPFPEIPTLMRRSRTALILYGSGAAYASRVPMRIFECMAAGLPFVAPELPGTASASLDGTGLLARAGDPVAYAVALSDLLGDASLRERMSERGRRLARDQFSWERESQKLVRLFEELIGPPPARVTSTADGLDGAFGRGDMERSIARTPN
jgi:glycosyltransferase involved in cell wall biosynthesis